MKLENLVTSLEMSRDLEEKGFDMDTCLWWSVECIDSKDISSFVQVAKITPFFLRETRENEVVKEQEYIPAYTFQQLWEVLPKRIRHNGTDYLISLYTADYPFIQWNPMNMSGCLETVSGTTLTDTAAAAVLWSIERKYLTRHDQRVKAYTSCKEVT